VSIFVPLILILLGIVILLLSRRKRAASGVPGGQVVYEDTGLEEFEPPRPLFSRRYMLAGKPDYLVKQGKLLIPVEVKSGRAPQYPYDNHVVQVIAYCLLIEDIYRVTPTHGIIRYPERSFEIPFNDYERQRLIKVIAEMRERLGIETVSRSHHFPTRCAGCGYRHDCDEALPQQQNLMP